jgi:hypothetical protein
MQSVSLFSFGHAILKTAGKASMPILSATRAEGMSAFITCLGENPPESPNNNAPSLGWYASPQSMNTEFQFVGCPFIPLTTSLNIEFLIGEMIHRQGNRSGAIRR